MVDIKVFVTELGSYYSEASEEVSSSVAELILLFRFFLPSLARQSAYEQSL